MKLTNDKLEKIKAIYQNWYNNDLEESVLAIQTLYKIGETLYDKPIKSLYPNKNLFINIEVD